LRAVPANVREPRSFQPAFREETPAVAIQGDFHPRPSRLARAAAISMRGHVSFRFDPLRSASSPAASRFRALPRAEAPVHERFQIG